MKGIITMETSPSGHLAIEFRWEGDPATKEEENYAFMLTKIITLTMESFAKARKRADFVTGKEGAGVEEQMKQMRRRGGFPE